MPQKQNPVTRKKNQDCLTLTSDVADILRAINTSKNKNAWKNHTSKLAKTINQNNIMTEDDLDRLFNNKPNTSAGKLTSSNKKKHHKNHLKNPPSKKTNKVKTQARVDIGWVNEIVTLGDTFKSDKDAPKPKNYADTVKFLEIGQEKDKLLSGVPHILITELFPADEKQQDEDRISQLFGKESQKSEKEAADLTQEFKKNYLVGKIVGEGAYASVRVAIHKPTNQKIAIKVYEKGKIKEPQRKKSVRRQIKILEMLNHPNIVRIHDVVETNHHLNIIMEYLPGISLNAYLKSQPNFRVPEKNCKKIIRALAEALKHLHQRNIAHRDIKLQNIILDDNLSPKLIDFGFSTCIESTKKIKMFCGTPSYMAPQIVQKKQYRGQPADIWALGVLFFVSLTGIFPFKGTTDQQLYKKIMNAEYPKLQIPSKETADLISKMLKINPDQRITAVEILSHSWIKCFHNNLLASSLNPLSQPTKEKLNYTNHLQLMPKKTESSNQRKKRTTASSHKSKEQALMRGNQSKKMAETCKQNLKMELRLARESPSHRIMNSSNVLKKLEPLATNNNANNIEKNNGSNANFAKTEKVGLLNSTLKRNAAIKTQTKVINLIRVDPRKKNQQKSKSKNRRI